MVFQNAIKDLRKISHLYAPAVIRVMQQEYPNQMQHIITGAEDRPRPRELHPAFYGCFDWHSSVEMHWVLVRLLRLVPESFDPEPALTVLDGHLTEAALQQEAGYMLGRRSFERPYGWGWALTFIHEFTALRNLLKSVHDRNDIRFLLLRALPEARSYILSTGVLSAELAVAPSMGVVLFKNTTVAPG